MGEISTLLIFKLADMINIALDEGRYYKQEEWCWENAEKYLVEGNPYEWNRRFLLALESFQKLNWMKSEKGRLQFEKFASIAEYFKNLNHPFIGKRPAVQDLPIYEMKRELEEIRSIATVVKSAEDGQFMKKIL